jgi:hypothetical protein
MLFTTFGIGRFEHASDILRNQARELKLFRKVLKPELDNEFIQKHYRFMQFYQRGFGYYIWKPHIILKSLQECEEGEILLYSDSGCRFGTSINERLSIWIDMLKNNSKNILGFTLTALELEWTKMDTINAINPNIKVNEFQHLSGIILFINNEFTRNFVKEWSEWAIKDNYHHFTDAPSQLLNYPSFQEHRHDQSVFSLLLKKYKDQIITIPDETYPPDEDKPIRALRAMN